MDNGSYNVGIGRVLKVLLAGGVALVAAAAAVVGTMTVTGHGRFNASSGSAGVAASTVVYHDSLTDRLMMNVANAGARYVMGADQAYTVGPIADGEYVLRSGETLAGGDLTASPISWNAITSGADSVGQGTWQRYHATAMLYAGCFFNSTAANGDNYSKVFRAPRGTYTLTFNYQRMTDRGIVDVYIDSTKVGTVDMYGAEDQVQVGTITGIALNGQHTLKFQLNGKHASSSSYLFLHSGIEFRRTGD